MVPADPQAACAAGAAKTTAVRARSGNGRGPLERRPSPRASPPATSATRADPEGVEEEPREARHVARRHGEGVLALARSGRAGPEVLTERRAVAGPEEVRAEDGVPVGVDAQAGPDDPGPPRPRGRRGPPSASGRGGRSRGGDLARRRYARGRPEGLADRGEDLAALEGEAPDAACPPVARRSRAALHDAGRHARPGDGRV